MPKLTASDLHAAQEGLMFAEREGLIISLGYYSYFDVTAAFTVRFTEKDGGTFYEGEGHSFLEALCVAQQAYDHRQAEAEAIS